MVSCNSITPQATGGEKPREMGGPVMCGGPGIPAPWGWPCRLAGQGAAPRLTPDREEVPADEASTPS